MSIGKDVLSGPPIGGGGDLHLGNGSPLAEAPASLTLVEARRKLDTALQAGTLGLCPIINRPTLEIGSPNTHFTAQPSPAQLLADYMYMRVYDQDPDDPTYGYSPRSQGASLLGILGDDALTSGHEVDLVLNALGILQQRWEAQFAA